MKTASTAAVAAVEAPNTMRNSRNHAIWYMSAHMPEPNKRGASLPAEPFMIGRRIVQAAFENGRCGAIPKQLVPLPIYACRRSSWLLGAAFGPAAIVRVKLGRCRC
jgi:hypothetical protein